jgi:Spy/CpxP family protein refolding chaperone
MMKKSLLLLAVLTLATLASAQERGQIQVRSFHGGPDTMGPMPPLRGPGGTWWKDSELATKLKLTEPQKQQLEKTFLDYRLKLVDLHADVEREELKLQPLMDADQVNEGQVSAALDTLIAARGKLEKTNAMMNIAMRKVLSTDQWKQLQSLRAERFHVMRGPGGGTRVLRGPDHAPPPHMEGPGEPPAAPERPTPPPGDSD